MENATLDERNFDNLLLSQHKVVIFETFHIPPPPPLPPLLLRIVLLMANQLAALQGGRFHNRVVTMRYLHGMPT